MPRFPVEISRYAGLCLLIALCLGWMDMAQGAVTVRVIQDLTPSSGMAGYGQDDSRSSITLRGGGGEQVVVQLLVRTDVPPLKDISFVFDVVGLDNLKAWRSWSIWNVPEVGVPVLIKGPMQPALQATEAGRFPRFDLPDANALGGRPLTEALPSVASCSVYIECELPRGKAGTYAGRLSMLSEGMTVAQIPVQVDVLPYDLPETPDFIVEMNSYGDWTRLLAPTVANYYAIHRLFRHFRSTFTLVPYRQDGSAVLPFLEPVVKGYTGGIAMDWQDFLKANGPLFDGTAFADGHPLSHFLLPFRYGWPVHGARDGDPRLAELRRNAGLRQAMRAFFAEKGWVTEKERPHTRFQEFHNENPEHGSNGPWFMDEPRTQQDMEGHALYTSFKVDGFPAYRVDISDWRRVRNGLERMGSYVDDWYISVNPAYLDGEALAIFRDLQGQRGSDAANQEGWLFGYGELAGFVRDGKAVSHAALVAALCRYWSMDLDGYAQWITDLWKPANEPELPPEARPLYFANAGGARTLFWPGTYLGVDGPLPSLRLFSVRQAVQMIDTASLVCRRHPERCKAVRERLASLSSEDERENRMYMQGLQTILTEHGEQ